MLKKIAFSVLGILVLLFGGTAIWMSVPFAYDQAAIDAAMQDSANVAVSSDDFVVFSPKDTQATTGLIFYPGGKTTAETFAPYMHSVAEAGYLAVVAPMPLKTAFLGIDKANEVMAAYPQIQRWVIAGHSLGGVGAAEYVKSADLSKLRGLLLLASYPASDISQLDIAVMSISGSKDLQSTPAKIDANKAKLPASTEYVVIDGANHWQFGAYAASKTQQSDLISPEQQATEILTNTLQFLAKIP